MEMSASTRVLVVANTAKDHLAMIAAARPWFETFADESGFAVEFTDDASAIHPENLADVAVFVQLQRAPFEMDASQQAALQAFVEDGGGWVGIHAAGLTGRQFIGGGAAYWEWFEAFLGGVTYSPHPAFQIGDAVVEDRTHPATRNLPQRFSMGDEWYEFSESPRGRVRVLAVADESSYRQNRPMKDHPIVWTNENFRRAIYIGLGHHPDAFTNDAFATLLRDSILWASS